MRRRLSWATDGAGPRRLLYRRIGAERSLDRQTTLHCGIHKRWLAPHSAAGRNDVYVRSDGTTATFRAGSWELGKVRASSLVIGGRQVVGSQAAAVASASGGTTVDSEARAVLDQILAALRQHGLIAP
jgi:hypothetical protein